MRRFLVVSILLLHKAFVPFSTPMPRLVTFDDYLSAIYQLQNFTEEAGFSAVKEALQEAYARPLDLNQVTAESLSALGILSSAQIKGYFSHLATTGPLYSKYELQAIPGFDLTTITLLLPFVSVAESYHAPTHSLKMQPNKPNYFLCRYTPVWNQAGSKALSTLGSLDKYTIGLSCNHQNDLTWGITARKQGGEAFCWDHATYRYGFNLWSLFLVVEKKKYIKRIIVGDYQIGYGQGLLLSAGYIHRGDLIRSIIRSNNLGIRPYKGIKRIGWRGIALTSDIGPIEVTGFYANNHLDATLQLDQASNPYIKRIDTTGKYDTIHHLSKKGTVNEQLLGCTLRKGYHRNQTEVGINLIYNHYDIPLLIRRKDATDGYWLQAQSAASLFYRLLWKNCLFFGEGGLTFPEAPEVNPRLSVGTRLCFSRKSPACGLIIGSIISLSRYVDLSIGLYHYDRALYTPYSAPFKRYLTDHGNEKGSYLGVTFTPWSNWTLSTSGHFFATLSPKPLLATASSGQRFVIRSSYTWDRSTIWTIQYKLDKNPRNKPKQTDKIIKVAETSRLLAKRAYAEKFVGDTERWNRSVLGVREDLSTGSTSKLPAEVAFCRKSSVKSKIDHQLTHYWWSRFELQYTSYAFLDETHHGYALSSRQKWKASKWQFACQAIYFNTANHATRLYFYLPSPLYSGITFRSYYGQGVATSGLICWKPMAFIRLEMIYTCIYSDDGHSKNERTQTNKPLSSVKHHGSIQLLVNF